jgi:hypothetical protein
LNEDIPIILFSSHGNYYCIIDSPLGDNVSLHRQQFTRAADPAFCLTTAKTIVAAKLHNCRLLLQRHQRRKQIPAVATAIERLGEASVRLAQAMTERKSTAMKELVRRSILLLWGSLSIRHCSSPDGHASRQPIRSIVC